VYSNGSDVVGGPGDLDVVGVGGSGGEVAWRGWGVGVSDSLIHGNRSAILIKIIP
jgi:hypothetical protein